MGLVSEGDRSHVLPVMYSWQLFEEEAAWILPQIGNEALDVSRHLHRRLIRQISQIEIASCTDLSLCLYC